MPTIAASPGAVRRDQLAEILQHAQGRPGRQHPDPPGLAIAGVDESVRGAMRHQQEAARANTAGLVADADIELALQQVPRLVDGIVHVQRRPGDSRAAR